MPLLRYSAIIPVVVSTLFADEEAQFSPDSLNIVQHLPTPIRSDALSFHQSWEPLFFCLSGNYLATYIDSVVNQDGIGISLSDGVSLPTYKLVPFPQQSLHPDDVQQFWDEAGPVFKSLTKQGNAFSLYFQGVFTFYGYPLPLQEGKEDDTVSHDWRSIAQQFLKQASEKHYVTATNFMLKNQLWDDANSWQEAPITKAILKNRKLKILLPHEIILQYIKNRGANGSTAWNDIKEVQELIELLPGDLQQNKQIFSTWSKELTERLIASKRRESIPLPSTLLLAYAFTSSLVYGANCVSNLVAGYSDDNLYTIATGFTQGVASFTGLATALANAPTALNIWYGNTFHTMEGKWTWRQKVPLLPSFYSNDEIVKQSYLIILYGLLYNKEELMAGNIATLLKPKRYIEKLRRLTLANYDENYEALATVLTKEDNNNFKL